MLELQNIKTLNRVKSANQALTKIKEAQINLKVSKHLEGQLGRPPWDTTKCQRYEHLLGLLSTFTRSVGAPCESHIVRQKKSHFLEKVSWGPLSDTKNDHFSRRKEEWENRHKYLPELYEGPMIPLLGPSWLKRQMFKFSKNFTPHYINRDIMQLCEYSTKYQFKTRGCQILW